MWFLRHPTFLAFLILFTVAAGSSALAKHEMTVNRGLQVQIDMANASLERQQKNQQIVTEVSHAYENRLADLNRRLASARVRPSRCIVPVPTASAGLNASPGASPGAVGITSESLLEYEGSCQREVYKLIGLQDFIRQTSGQ